MATLINDNHPPSTLLDHQWINSDQGVEYLKAIKERSDNQLRDFCMRNKPFSSNIYCLFYLHSIVIQSSTLC
jgi:hypothetical protein